MTDLGELRLHFDPAFFAEAVRYTAGCTRFDPRLIEKDYFCTLILGQLSGVENLVFKGGTCLAKVYAGFYRLSEDLDFTIPVLLDATRGRRRALIAPVKAALEGLPDRYPEVQLTEPLTGANVSTQYLATVAYASVLDGHVESVKIEVALREPLLLEPPTCDAATILLDPLTDQQAVAPIPVRSIALREAMAEKLRAALSRREPEIRDFFDIDFASRRLHLVNDHHMRSLLMAKLGVPGNFPVDLSESRLAELRGQVATRLEPALRGADLAGFDLDRAFGIVAEVARLIPGDSLTAARRSAASR